MPEPIVHTSRRRVSHRPSPRVIREFSDRGTLWLLEDPANLQGLVQIVEPALVEQLDFAHAERVNRSFIPASCFLYGNSPVEHADRSGEPDGPTG